MFLLLAVFAVSSINVFAQTSTPSSCSEFASGPALWPNVLNAALIADGESSQAEQTISINVTSLPAGAPKWRVYKTVANGSNYWGTATDLVLGANHLTVDAVDYDRAVKFQFNADAADVEFDVLTLNGVQSSCVPMPTTSSIDFCGDFVSSTSSWASHIYEAVSPSDGALSQAAQTLTINVTSLPEGVVNWRFYRTTANGSANFGAATQMTLGLNTITVPAVSFDRAVKFQFSSGDVEFDALSLNGANSSCVQEPGSFVMSDCDAFSDGPNDTWTHVLTSCVVDDGNSGEAQTMTINITSLPDGGANFRVVKSTANGNWFNAAANALSLGANTINVSGVSFARTVKFQFSNGDVEFDALSVNGVEVSCDAPVVVDVPGCMDANACNHNSSATVDDNSCTYPASNADCNGVCDEGYTSVDGSCVAVVNGCMDANACNHDADANVDDNSCLYADIFGICDGDNTIQGAIDAATDGDVINVPSGSYSEALVINKSLTINGSGSVTLSVSGNTTGITVSENTSDVVIDGFTITGDESTGSGITVQPGASNVTISNNTISDVLLPGGGNSSPLSYGILCWGNTTPVNPPTNINITNNSISNVLGSAISLGTNTANVTISGNSFSNIVPVSYSTSSLAIGVQAELSDGLDINNNSYSDLTHANSLVNCTNASVGNNTYSNSPLMLNSTHPHTVAFSDAPWWNVIYDATFAGDLYQAYYSDTINAAYQGLVQAYAGLGAPIWSSLSSSNPGCTDGAACNYNAQALSDDGSCSYAAAGLDCDGNCLADADNDGVCDGDEIVGCQDATACNYNADATDAGDCVYTAASSSIRAQADYTPTTGFSIGAFQDAGTWTPAGYVLADQFQINLEYQDGIDQSAIDTWNDWAGVIGAGTGVNWHDPQNYVLSIDVDGGLAAGTYGADPVYDYSETFQWTITGWNQTILAGTIEDGRLVVSGGYRSFTGEVNIQESFSGSSIQTELVALTFEGDVASIGAGTVFGVELREDACEACSGATDGSGTVVSTDSDGDGVCDGDEVVGCQDATACNYNAAATDAGDCSFPEDNADCNGDCLAGYTSVDGSCVAIVSGCTDTLACNTTPGANVDDGSCLVPNAEDCESCLDGAIVVGVADCSGECGGDDQTVSAFVDMDGDGYTSGDAVDVCADCASVQATSQWTSSYGSGEETVATISISASDLPLDENGNAPSSVSINSYLFNYYYSPDVYSYPYGDGSWFGFAYDVDGESAAAGDDITGFETLTLSSYDIDGGGGDQVYMAMVLDLTYPAAVSCTLPAGYVETSLGEDCNDTLATAFVDLGCGCGEPAALEGLDCDGNCLNGGAYTSISVREGSSWGSYYSFTYYGGTWALVDLSTGDSIAEATSDDETLCLLDGCYEISGTSGSGPSYPFSYSIDGSAYVTPGSTFGSDIFDLGSSCTYGCMDSTAFNYDSGALVDDGSCVAVVEGCTDSTAFNYNSAANTDDGSCIPVVNGCTNALANNFDVNANTDDGSCVVCLDGVEVSADSLAVGQLPDDIIVVTINTGTDWSEEIHWELLNDGSLDVLLSGGNSIPNVNAGLFPSYTNGDYADNTEYVIQSGCLVDDCYKLITYDTYGDGWNGNGTFGVTTQFGTVLIPTTVMGASSGDNAGDLGYGEPYQELATYFELGSGQCAVYGCTDSTASNYDSGATVDDESCVYCEEGSVDVTFSFNQEVTTSDEVYVYNEVTGDTVFSVEPYELNAWEGKSEILCVPVGCYVISMGSLNNGGWTDGSQLQVLDDLTDDYYFLDVDDATLDMTVISIGGGVCDDDLIGGCTDPSYDNYDSTATFDNNSCVHECANANAGSTSEAVAGELDTFGPWVYMTADADGNGAEVTFEELAENVEFGSYISFSLDSCTENDPITNISGLTIDLDAGQTLYFQALNPYDFVDSVTTIQATLFEIPDSSFFGCMDSIACNYDENATYQPDLACEYALAGYDCDSVALPSFVEVDLDFTGSFDLCSHINTYDAADNFPGAWYYTSGPDYAVVFESNGLPVQSLVQHNGTSDYVGIGIYEGHPDSSTAFDNNIDYFAQYGSNLESDIIFNTDSGSTYFVLFDSYSSTTCYSFDVTLTALTGIGGCMDTLACNYSDSAAYDDGSCLEDLGCGCGEPAALAGFDCDGNFTGSACGVDGNVLSDSITVPYGNNEYQVFEYPSDGVTPVSILWTSGDTENNYDEFAIYDGVGEGAISTSNLITEIEDNLPNQFVSGTGNGLTVVWSSDYSVNGDETFGNLVWNVYCADFVWGCMDTLAANYDSLAQQEDGSCEYLLVQGCTDTLACNFDSLAQQDNGSCSYAVAGFDCDGNCLTGTFVEYDPVGGYSYAGYSNFEIADCDGEVIASMTSSLNGFGECVELPDNFALTLTTDFTSTISYWSGSVNIGDSAYVLGDFSGYQLSIIGDCGVLGCTDSTALNFDTLATYDDGTCEYPLYEDVTLPFVEGGLTTCGFNEDYEASNTSYSGSYMNGDDVAYAFNGTGNNVIVYMGTDDTYTGVFVFGGDPLSGSPVVAQSTIGFGGGDHLIEFETNDSTQYFVVVDSWPAPQCFDFNISISEVVGAPGCMDSLACNFTDTADYDDGSCIYPLAGFDCDTNFVGSACGVDGTVLSDSITVPYGNGEYQVFEYPSDGVTPVSILWTSGDTENNYDEFAIYDGVGEGAISTANFITEIEDNLPNQYVSGTGNGLTVVWSSDGSVNGDESFGNLVWNVYCANFVFGCTDTLATNYDSTAFYDDESCEYDFVFGCIDTLACNYVDTADVDDGSCTYADAGYDCNGDCLADADADGICDDDEVAGCNDVTALNYNPLVTDADSTLCEYCTDNNTLLVMEDDYYSGGWEGATFTMTPTLYSETSFTTFLDADGLGNGNYDEEYLCVPTGCYDVTVGGGSYDYEITFSLGDILVDAQAGTYTDIAFGATADFDPCAVPGCIDSTAVNFNPDADVDDGSCTLTMVTTVCGTPNSVRFTGPWWGWDPAGGPEGVDNGDGTWTFTLPNMTAAMEYLLVVNGTMENFIAVAAADSTFDWSCVAVTDYANYANRQWTPADGYTISNIFNSCEDTSTYECPVLVAGCMDSLANNYNADADVEDASCLYDITFNVDMNCYDGTFSAVHWVSNWTGWGVGEGSWNEMTDTVGDGIYSITVSNVPFGFDYKYMVDNVHEDLLSLYSDTSAEGVLLSDVSCVGNTDYWSYANRLTSSLVANEVFGSCDACVYGCTDASADNHDPSANADDGSCTYCDAFSAVLIGSSDATAFGESDGSVQATGSGGSNNYNVIVIDSTSVQYNPFALAAGDYLVVVNDVTSGCADTVAVSILEPAECVSDSYASAYVDVDGDGYTIGDAEDVCLECSTVQGTSQWTSSYGNGEETEATISISASDLPLDENGNAPSSVSINSYLYNYYYSPDAFSYQYGDGSWFGFAYDVDGESAAAGDDITGFETLTLSSYDIDGGGGDQVYMAMVLDLTYPAAVSCTLPEGYVETSLGEDCNDSDVSIGPAGLGEDCDGNCLSGDAPVAIIFTDNGVYDSECSWNITDGDGNIVATSDGNQSGTDTTQHCFDFAGGCFDLNLFDAYSDGWGGSGGLTHTLTVGDSAYTFVPYTGSSVPGAPSNADNVFSHIIGGGCVTACADSAANNANFDADIIDNSLCTYDYVQGCMDSTACNYNSDAEQDDNSCTYAETGFDCNGNCLVGTLTSISVREVASWGSTYSLLQYGGSWDLVDLSTGSSMVAATSDDESLCLPDGCYEISGTSGSGPTYPFGYSIDGAAYVVPGSTSGSDILDLGSSCTFGCTDSAAFNYDSGALVDDGSCIAVVQGCMDSTACNYDSAANTDDSSCTYAQANYDCAGNCLTTPLEITVTVCTEASEVRLTGPWWSWDPNGGPVAAANGDGTFTFTFCPAPSADMEYLLVVDGVQENLITAPHPDMDGDGYGDMWDCATVTDYWSYANRVWSVGSGNASVTYGTCGSCSDVYGCMDVTACNFDSTANVMDYNLCTYPDSGFNCDGVALCSLVDEDADGVNSCDDCNDSDASASVDLGCGCGEPAAATGYDCAGNCLADADGDGICDEFEVDGCTDITALNYSASATDDDGSCEYSTAGNPCDYVPTGLSTDNVIHNRVRFNWASATVAPSHYMIRYRPVGTNNWTVITAGTVNTNEFNGTSRTRWWMSPGTTYEWNIRARKLNADGTVNCQSAWSMPDQFTTLPECPNLENLSVSTEAIWATFGADVSASEEVDVWQTRAKLREVGTNAFRYVFGDADGISSTKGNFEPSTDYEWHTKAWCTGNVDSDGNSDPMYHSGWGEYAPFSTQAPCDKMPYNFATTSNNAQTAITMSWNTPLTGAPDHYFLYLENLGTGDVYAWNDIPGEATSKTKYNLTPGEYAWKIRGACGTEGTSWATTFSQPIPYTLGGAKLENSSVANLDVYPNPSRDIFNVTFTSEEEQTMTVKVVNMIGEEIFTEELTEFVGQYTKVIDMNNQPKGVYFLEITTSTGGINKKIVLQ